MSKYSWSETDDRRTEPEDIREAPTGQVNDNSYVSAKSDTASVPVIGDEAAIEDHVKPGEADSEQQLREYFHMSVHAC